MLPVRGPMTWRNGIEHQIRSAWERRIARAALIGRSIHSCHMH